MPGLRQILRNIRVFCGNLPALPKALEMLCNDKLEPSTLSAARRLVARGHSVTVSAGLPVAADGTPIPWYTYPFLDYISDLDTSRWKILEFGSGQSTLFWASRAASILAYESSRTWMGKMRDASPPNVELRWFGGEPTLEELGGLGFVPDLVVVDGHKRGACAAKSIEAFGLRPLYILENSDWFPEAAAAMREAGLVEVRFKGFGPINGYAWATSLMFANESLDRLHNICADHRVPGGLAAGDYEKNDLALRMDQPNPAAP